MMARDGGYCNCCGKHHIQSGVDYGTGKDSTSLLIIELQDETSVPKVFYEGEEITDKVRVSFDWITKGCMHGSGGTKFNIEHLEMGHNDLVRKGVGLCCGQYATD